MTYSPRRPCSDQSISVRGINLHLCRWPGADSTPTVLLHGWGDCAATFQFLVDHLAVERNIIAPDMRGFGDSQWASDCYWFPDYLADLDAMLERLSPGAPVNLIGHSMGGNIASLYAGIRPERVRVLINLEGFGLARTTPDQAPANYRNWLERLRQEPEPYSDFASFAQFEELLRKRNPRTAPDRIAYIARAWGRQAANGQVIVKADPRHKWPTPVLYRREESEACWRQIKAPTLLVAGARSDILRHLRQDADPKLVAAAFSHAQLNIIENAGHMLHHECPEAVAALIESFLSQHAAS